MNTTWWQRRDWTHGANPIQTAWFAELQITRRLAALEEQFRVASGLLDESAKKQVSTLLYCLGEEAETVLASTNITDEQRKVYDTVINKFDSFFKVTRNVIFERARFNRRVQVEGETAEQFIVELYNLSEFCDRIFSFCQN